MKRNVSVKVFATKTGDLNERSEKPVFRRELYQVDETDIEIWILKAAVDFLWADLHPVMVIEIF